MSRRNSSRSIYARKRRFSGIARTHRAVVPRRPVGLFWAAAKAWDHKPGIIRAIRNAGNRTGMSDDRIQVLAPPLLAPPSSGTGAATSAAWMSQFCVGGVSVGLTGDDRAAVALVPSLAPFRAEMEFSDVHIRVKWVDELIPTAGLPLFDSGALWRLYESRDGFQFDFRAPVFGERPYKRLLVDAGFSRATLQLSEEVFAAFPDTAPLDYPLDELLIMHRLTQEKAIELHSCGIVRPDGTGNLFVGHSGAGKSTTTRLWREREEVEVLSDDRIIVRWASGHVALHSGPRVGTPLGVPGRASEHGVLRLRDCSASRTNHSTQDDRGNGDGVAPNDKGKTSSGMRMYGTPWHGEAAYASPGSAALARIFILEHGQGNVLTRLSPSQAVAELFARSFVPFHRHEYVESALEFLQEVVDTVPCYRYAFEPNPGAVERILNFCD